MPIQFACPSCNKQLKISNPALAGKKLKCPKCAAVITAPLPTEDDAPPTPTVPAKPSSAPVQRPEAVEELRPAPPPMPPRQRREDEMEEDELEMRAPPPRRRASPQPVAARPGIGVPIMVGLISLLYLGALVAVFLGFANTLLLGDVGVSKARVGEQNRDNKNEPGNPPRFDPADFDKREKRRLVHLAAMQVREQKLLEEWRKQGVKGPVARSFRVGDAISPTEFALSPDSTALVAVSNTDLIAWDLETGKERWQVRQKNPAIAQTLSMAADGRTFATLVNKQIEIRDMQTGHLTRAIAVPWASFLVKYGFLPDGKTLAAESGFLQFDGIHFWDANTGNSLPAWGVKENVSFHFQSGGHGLLTKIDNSAGRIHLFDWASRDQVGSLPIGINLTPVIELSPDGKSVAKLKQIADSTIHIVALATGMSIWTFEMPDPVRSMCFSPDGKYFAAACQSGPGVNSEGAFKLWELATGKQLRSLGGPKNPVGDKILFSQGGQFLVCRTYQSPEIHFYPVEVLANESKYQEALATTRSSAGMVDKIKEWANVETRNGQLQVFAKDTVTNAQLGELKQVPQTGLLHLQNCDKLTDAGLAIIKDLPNLEILNLSGARALTGKALRHLAGCQNLRELALSGMSDVDDNALAHLAGLTKLHKLDLSNNSFTDAGMAHLKEMVSLETLILSRANITAQGLASLKGMTHMHALVLDQVPVTDEGMAHLADMTELYTLDLSNAKISDVGLAHLRNMTKLVNLDLRQNPITGVGLGPIAGMKDLYELNLHGTQLTDEGLAHAKGLKNLRTLYLGGTKVSDAGLAHVAELTLLKSLGITDLPNVKGPGLQHLRKLAHVGLLSLVGTGVTNDGLANLKVCTQMSVLYLPTQISDAGLEHLGSLPELTHVGLDGLKGLKGSGLKYLKASRLESLILDKTGVTDEGLAGVKELTQIKTLALSQHNTDAGLAHLKGLTKLETLILPPAKVTDAGLTHLETLAGLHTLIVGDLKFSDDALAKLKKALPKLNVER